ncbi:MAG: biotin transporter BioY, partial [Clostridia bacterium]|nr:biotin transporter BioY [Clostridia bacterium]
MKARMMARCALFVSLTVLGAWAGVPMPPVRFTLQTLAVMTALGILGGRWGALSVLVYLLLGLAGLPVFSGFRGGLGAFLDPTGGFLTGLLLGALLYWAVEKI